ncbi:MAG: AMP-binding protein, partial [Bacteroidota bacterium]
KEKAHEVFLRQPFGDSWKEMTWGEAGQEARRMAAALQSMGLKAGDHVAIVSKNCYHWILADLAIMIGGFVSTPFYANLSSEQMTEVLDKSDARAVFVGKLDTWDNIDGGIPKDFPIIKFPHYSGNAKVTRGKDWDELIAAHDPIKENPLPELDSLWTVLFTSGTTGTPKGVMHTYKNAALICRGEVLNDTLKVFSVKQPVFFSFLPLNHIAERTAVEIAALIGGGSISFAESLDTFAKNLQDTQPTLFFAVPRIWTKFNLGVLSKMPQEKLDRFMKIPILNWLVKRKIKKSLGLSRAKIILTGASITPETLKQWYRNLGINLREVYGMTENFGGFSMMPEFQHKPNTVGKPMAFCEGKIHPDTGEIMMKLPWMMEGYYKDPDLTAKVLVDDWLHTGDKGQMDSEGFIKIIGRVKDAFKTSKGKFVVPTILEDKFSDNSNIEQLCVVGLGVPQPIALVNLSEIGLAEDKAVITQNLSDQLDEVNKALHGHEVISTVVVLEEAWSPENEMLTPTLKIRRGKIDENYMEQYAKWQAVDAKVIWHDSKVPVSV